MGVLIKGMLLRELLEMDKVGILEYLSMVTQLIGGVGMDY